MQHFGRGRSILKHWILPLILIVMFVITTGCSSEQASRSVTNLPAPPSISPAVPSPAAPLAPPARSPVPQIDVDRLFQHVQALSFERHGAADRAQAQEYLTEQLTAFGWNPRSEPFDGGVNLVAERRGTDARAAAILVTAHYDTVRDSPGADDNASAVAAALELARLLGPRSTLRPLRLIFFDREEAGLLGSFAYTAKPENLSNVQGVVNLEMMGYACYTPGCQKYPTGLPITPPTDRGDFLGVIVDLEHQSLLTAFQNSGDSTLPPIIGLPVPLKGLLTPDLLRSDHAPFWAKNIGAVMVADTANFRNPHYHQPSDTPDTLDRAFLTGSAQLVLNAVSTLLDSREPVNAMSVE
jgi:hypothetical protein